MLETKKVILNLLFMSRDTLKSAVSTYASDRWGSCWPGSVECQHRSCTDTSAYRAKSGCPLDPTDTPHTHCCCHCSHHQTAGEKIYNLNNDTGVHIN